MSLDERQRQLTSREFESNLAASGLVPAEIEQRLGMPPEELASIVAMTPDVAPDRAWLLRDFLDHSIRLRGLTPTPWATMTEARRADAERWFASPHHPATDRQAAGRRERLSGVPDAAPRRRFERQQHCDALCSV